MSLTRDDAWALLTEHTKGDGLLKHALAVEAAVRGYARTFGEDEEAWGITALLHDFDYERWPTLGDHPNKGAEILRAKGYPEGMVGGILAPAPALVRPSKSVLDLEAKSVVKRMKDKAFARGVKREDLHAGAALLGLPLEAHIDNVIAFLRRPAGDLGLRGTL